MPTFMVETGTGLTNSNAYASLVAFKAYHDDRGNSYSAYADAAIQTAIVRASDYIDYRFNFVGYRKTTSQAMEWPRYDARYNDGRQAVDVPIEVIEACCEYALRALAAPIAPDPITDSSGRLLTSDSKKVGPIEVSKQFSRDGTTQTFRPYPAADSRLRELITSGNRVLRA